MSELQSYLSSVGRVTNLTDGTSAFGADAFPSLTEDAVHAALQRAGESELTTEFNAFLLDLDGQPLTLVDTGCGAQFGAAGGNLAALLRGLQIAPSDIKRVIFTHLHGDHVGGAIEGETPVFDQAEVILSAQELAHWQGTDGSAATMLTAYKDKIRTVQDGEDIAPGLRAWALPGHTPGHMGVRIGEDLVLLGDVLHAEALQLPTPSVSIKFDVDPDLAARTRTEALGQVCDQGLVFSGGHQVGQGKFARMQRVGDGFKKVAL